MVWTAGRAAASRESQREVGVVVRGGRYKAGARDEGDDDPATVAVFGITGEDSGDGAGVFVGGATERGVCGREISRVGVCGVLPACAEAAAEGHRRGCGERDLCRAGGALEGVTVV